MEEPWSSAVLGSRPDSATCWLGDLGRASVSASTPQELKCHLMGLLQRLNKMISLLCGRHQVFFPDLPSKNASLRRV